MTREEARHYLSVPSSTNGSGRCTDEQHYEAKQIAIKALDQEPCEDCISRQAVLASIKNLYPDMPIIDFMGARRKWLDKYAPYFECENAVEQLPSVTPKEPKTDYKAFAEWVAGEIFSDEWEYNKDAFAEIACRKLAKLGIVEESGDSWVLKESEG